MTKIIIAASALAFVAATSVYAAALTEKQVEGVQTAIKAAGCTVEDSDIIAKGEATRPTMSSARTASTT